LKAPALVGQDASTRDDIVAAGAAHMDVVKQGLEALRKGDADAYAAINDRDITASGAKYSAGVERFQQFAIKLNDDALADERARLSRVIVLVCVADAVGAADRRRASGAAQAGGDAAEPGLRPDHARGRRRSEHQGAQAGRNEIGQLLDALSRMQHGLTETVAKVRAGSDAVTIGARKSAGNTDLSSRTEQQSSALEQPPPAWRN
jgi:methyl-accepting chemotaxis protein